MNLPADTTDAELAALFAPFGAVTAAAVWGDLGPDRQYRVGFVALSAGWDAAVGALDGSDYRGLTLRARVIRPWDGTSPGRVRPAVPKGVPA